MSDDRRDIGQPAGVAMIQAQLDAADELLFQKALASRRGGEVFRIGNQGTGVGTSVNTPGEARRAGQLALQGANLRTPLTAVERSEAFADQLKKKQDLEASETTSILAALIAGADKTFFTRDVDIPEEIEDEETLGLQTTLAG